ncbi:unnamed protein product [marine sediment metagenome]|uniref:Uncharacterized protein n=1 Tax=marine sediment metagenome TaxID=412755 RepID=X0UKV7_9ZZZZ
MVNLTELKKFNRDFIWILTPEIFITTNNIGIINLFQYIRYILIERKSIYYKENANAPLFLILSNASLIVIKRIDIERKAEPPNNYVWFLAF